jgi:hypothetical protein
LHKAREIEEELLCRTIFVTNVLNLNESENLESSVASWSRISEKLNDVVRETAVTPRFLPQESHLQPNRLPNECLEEGHCANRAHSDLPAPLWAIEARFS